jgi:hypothetical protein
MLILRGWTCLNLNWIKSYNVKYKIFLFTFFNFVRKKLEIYDSSLMSHQWWFYNHFFANYIKIFCKTEIHMVILRYLLCLNLNWIKSSHTILAKIIIFSCLKIHYFRTSLLKWVLTPPKKPALRSSKWLFFQNFSLSWNT